MGKTTVQSVADSLQILIARQSNLASRMSHGEIGRRKAYEELKAIRAEINELVGRLGSM